MLRIVQNLYSRKIFKDYNIDSETISSNNFLSQGVIK